MAYFDSFLTNTIVGNMTQQEATSFGQTGRKALDSAADGETTPWHLPAGDRRMAIDGEIRTLATKQDKGQTCRQVQMDLRRGSAHENWIRWFCKQSNGQWKSRHVGE